MMIEALCLGGPLDGQWKSAYSSGFWHRYINRSKLPSIFDFKLTEVPETATTTVDLCCYKFARRIDERGHEEIFWLADES